MTTLTFLGERSGARRRLTGWTQRWLVFAGCVLLWQWGAGTAHSPAFPTPLTILRTIRTLWLSGPASHLFLTHGVTVDVLPSVARVLTGWVIASVLGAAIGVLIGLSPVLADYTGPVLAFARALPPVMLVPMFMELFRLGNTMQVSIIVFGSIWPVLLNAVDGARSVDSTKIDTARAFRIGRLRWIGSVVLPSATPKIFAGLRIALSFALVLMVVSELMGSVDGLGYRITSAEQVFDYPAMWAGIVVIGAMGYLFNRVLITVENRVLAWHHGSLRLLEG